MNREDVLSQLDRVSSDMGRRDDERSAIKKWAITVWFAGVVAIATEKIALSVGGQLFLLVCPCLMFWAMDLAAASITSRQREFVRSLERRLANNDFSGDPIQIYHVSSMSNVSWREKFGALFLVAYSRERTAMLYLCAILFSITFVWIKARD